MIPGARDAPVVSVSALDGTGVDTLVGTALRCYDRWQKTIPENDLQDWLNDIRRIHPPPPFKRGWGPPILRSLRQTSTRPPTFVLGSDQDHIKDNYMKFFARSLRQEFLLEGTSLRVTIKNTKRGRKTKKRKVGKWA
jgi:GTP-binding protein